MVFPGAREGRPFAKMFKSATDGSDGPESNELRRSGSNWNRMSRAMVVPMLEIVMKMTGASL